MIARDFSASRQSEKNFFPEFPVAAGNGVARQRRLRRCCRRRPWSRRRGSRAPPHGAERRAPRSRPSPRAQAGGPGLKNTLIQCTWAAARKNGSNLQAQFQRLRSRPATKRTIGALAAPILTAAYHMLKHGTLYHDLGPNTSTAGPRPFRPGRLITHLHKLGYAVRITL